MKSTLLALCAVLLAGALFIAEAASDFSGGAKQDSAQARHEK